MTQSPNTSPRLRGQESQTSGNELNAPVFGVAFVAAGAAIAAETSLGAFALPANFELAAATFSAIVVSILAVSSIRRAVNTRKQSLNRVNNAG